MDDDIGWREENDKAGSTKENPIDLTEDDETV
jgi:hypothetical protein